MSYLPSAKTCLLQDGWRQGKAVLSADAVQVNLGMQMHGEKTLVQHKQATVREQGHKKRGIANNHFHPRHRS